MTRRIKTTVVREHVNPQVAERRTWAKFGLEKGNAPGPSFDTTSVGENIAFRPSVNWKVQAAEAEKNGGEKGSMKDQLKDKKVKCRICSGEHFTARCPFKDTMAPVDEPSAGGEGGAEDSPAAGALGAGTSSYVPPHLRKGAAGGGERMAGKYEKDDLATLRVTNVSFPNYLTLVLNFTGHCFAICWSPRRGGGGVEGTGNPSFPPFVPLSLSFSLPALPSLCPLNTPIGVVLREGKRERGSSPFGHTHGCHENSNQLPLLSLLLLHLASHGHITD